MSVFGGMSKGERKRIKIRVRTAMSSQAQLQGRYLGGRPPYGYRITDAGPHPNPSKAAAGQLIHKLEPDPVAAPIVQRIFTMLTREGIPCPSAHDAARNPHWAKTAWQQGAVRAILINPRYTGYEIWNKQRKEERLLDVDDVTLGHTSRMTHNPAEESIRSNEPAHEAIISPSRFDTVQALRRPRARNQGRRERAGKQGARPYALRGRVRCSLCGRKMQPATIRSRVYYRCECKEEEAALYPDLTHPRTVYPREDSVCQALDRWIARAFALDRLSATIEALTHASAAASTAEGPAGQGRGAEEARRAPRRAPEEAVPARRATEPADH
ncbi:recombinase family protein [Streptomyces glomeratus]|uniref:Recombinase domain-containing protein n=1 Tax=Streptomyces glomeratus TaxID=284452 RepID=A0ABP6L051_9ACTN|nr:recombinase family protein [Streptomyces glomeratus]MCF1509080.1 recombinase family protein [Streptomyces glomeratus]